MKLIIPEALREEFTTIEDILAGTGKTKRADALLLSWIKYEKQLRRLCSFLIFQNSAVTEESLIEVVAEFVKNEKLYAETFIDAIKKLGATSIPELLGAEYGSMWLEISKVKKIRNKLMHGQVTGRSIGSTELERCLEHVINWIATLAQAAQETFGYDGLGRNTFKIAKKTTPIHVQNYPFSNLDELKTWISKLKC